MRNVLSVMWIAVLGGLPAGALASAFDDHTNWQQEPMLETAKPLSLGRSVLEMGTGLRYLNSTEFFNSGGKIQEAPYKYNIYTWDFFMRFGFTENWTLWANLPVVWSELSNYKAIQQDRQRKTSGKLGDSDVGVLYQFFHHADPMVSMAFQIRWRLPTGAEAPGQHDVNIAGTGLTDVDISYLGRIQPFRNLSLGWGLGYNIRFPGAVQYINDQALDSSFTNNKLDPGDELYGQADVTAAIDWVSLQVLFRFMYRLPTQMASPEFKFQTMKWKLPNGEEVSEEYVVFNGATYHDLDVREKLQPAGKLVSSAGYLFTIQPRIIVRPVDWLDLTLFAKLYPIGQNSIYVHNSAGDNPSVDNFMPMQALGTKMGILLGEVGGSLTYRW
ncbi:MAG: hypothetical protein GYA21_19605 [Myxococcales bacterium]|nr:hypothetical protein [Myxococcales bacterium]